MTSAVHGGIHNVSRHVVSVGRVDIMSSICGLAVLRNQVLIYCRWVKAALVIIGFLWGEVWERI